MNVKLMRKIQKVILEEPRRLNMVIFGAKVSPKDKRHPPCGTIACIAGHADMLTNPKLFFRSFRTNDGISIERRATRACKLTGAQASRLFLKFRFPGKSGQRRYDSCRTAKSRAKWAVDRIEHFIKTKGAE